MSAIIDSYGKAIAAYARAGRDDAATPPEEIASSGSSFAELVRGQLADSIAAGKQAEAESVAAVSGHGDLGQVITAVSEAETTLQTMVAVRDRVLDAYKEILRMPI